MERTEVEFQTVLESGGKLFLDDKSLYNFLRVVKNPDLEKYADQIDLISQISQISLPMNGIDLIFILKKMNLKSLDLQYNKITDFSPLQTHYNLHSLNLAYNGAKNVKDFIKCSELQTLVLNMNKINDCSGLEQIINLQILNLGYNQFKNINPLQNLVNLTWLDSQCNRFEDFSPLSQLVKLEALFLLDCQISNISFLTKLVKISQSGNIEHISKLNSQHLRAPFPNQTKNIGHLQQSNLRLQPFERSLTQTLTNEPKQYFIC
ncbi:leucine-rich_repeat domain-containing protein [Hexamita inflata]|uniref:Leucine-rich repeat domain-containing protein n=1 Tax=Hexamita inflata TaxID=28002 RepID=A0AA86PK76_9EUKA|nr:leucine-rich repeat domain-containing protein [Hexamita inflata]